MDAEAERLAGKAPDGDRATAVRDYRLPLAEGVPFAWAFYDCGSARKEQGDLSGAIADYDGALELDPRAATAWINRGVAREEQGDLARDTSDFAQALAVAPPRWKHRTAAGRRLAEARAALAAAGKQ